VAVSNPWLAFPHGADRASVNRALHAAYETFLAGGVPDSTVRQVVLESWRRSVSSGVDPEDPELLGPTDSLRDYRESHPLAAVMPVVQRLLVTDAAESGLIVAVGDAAGRLLWVDGERRLRSRAADMGFVEGAVWS
jgi:transcriptional regulator of acetoin/glycerol metabolism